MSEVNIFEQGTRLGLRFQYRGLIGIEDLWVLSLNELNTIAVGLHDQLQKSTQISFIEETPQENIELQLKLDVVKRVIEVKLEEKQVAQIEAERKAQKQRLLEVINQKKDEQLTSMSLEELEAQLQAL